MEVVVHRAEFLSLIEPYYPRAGNVRQPVRLSIMLHVYLLKQRFNISDPVAQDALYESRALQRFADVNLRRTVPSDHIIPFRA